jgi:predicted nucleic acid-binding protein
VGNGRLVAVADAGPLIHLTEIGCLPILSIFGDLHVPEAVWAETVGCDRTSGEDLFKSSNVKRHTIPREDITNFIEKNNLKDLHSGECECLFLSKQINVPILLTDDLAVREAAKNLKLVPVGSLGIVAKAYHLGKISMADAQHHILNLYEVSSLFVTKVIVEMAIDQLQNPVPS